MNKNRDFTIGFVSTYIPRECGIATFTNNLMSAIKSVNKNIAIKVIAINDKKYEYSKEVVHQIDQISNKSYIEAANFINNSDIDTVVVQHEFNIFGGVNGSKILHLLKNITKPVILTMHTVPVYQKKPFPIIPKKGKARTILLKKIFPYVDGIIVMNNIAKEYIVNGLRYREKTIAIPHGAPFLDKGILNKYRGYKEKLGFKKNDIIISTFGLIAPAKGLEYVIRAMKKIVKKNQNAKYLIAGKIHPKKSIEYINSLKNLAKKNGIERNVIFDSRYLTYEEIYKYLANTDVYITPYYRKEQSSSGTLSYALAAGCCIVSTPYLYAYDLIKKYRVGELVEFNNSDSIANVLIKLVENRNLINKFRSNTDKIKKIISWPNVAEEYIKFYQNIEKGKK